MNPNPFVPFRDGQVKFEAARQDVQCNSDQHWNLVVSDRQTSETVFTSEGEGNGLEFTALWDGRDLAEYVAQTGDYTVRVSHYCKPFDTTSTSDVLQVLGGPRIVFQNDERAFSPNGDGSKDTFRIAVTLADTDNIALGDSVTDPQRGGSPTKPIHWNVLIKDSTNSIRKSYSGSGGSVDLTWDGRDTNGLTLAEGVYLLVVEATDANGQTSASRRDIRIDTTPPVLQAIGPRSSGVEPFIVTWSALDQSPIEFYDADWRVDNEAWRSWFRGRLDTSMAYSPDGSPSDRIYYFRFRAKDIAGNISAFSPFSQGATIVFGTEPQAAGDSFDVVGGPYCVDMLIRVQLGSKPGSQGRKRDYSVTSPDGGLTCEVQAEAAAPWSGPLEPLNSSAQGGSKKHVERMYYGPGGSETAGASTHSYLSSSHTLQDLFRVDIERLVVHNRWYMAERDPSTAFDNGAWGADTVNSGDSGWGQIFAYAAGWPDPDLHFITDGPKSGFFNFEKCDDPAAPAGCKTHEHQEETRTCDSRPPARDVTGPGGFRQEKCSYVVFEGEFTAHTDWTWCNFRSDWQSMWLMNRNGGRWEDNESNYWVSFFDQAPCPGVFHATRAWKHPNLEKE